MDALAKVRLSAKQYEYLSDLISADPSFAEVIRIHPQIHLKPDAIILNRSEAEALSDYFSDRLAKVGFDEQFEPDQEGRLLEGLIDDIFQSSLSS